MMLGVPPPQGAARGFIYESGFWVVRGGDSSSVQIPSSRSHDSQERVLGLCYTHLLCVNKCLQFYIKEEISVRVADCIFFTFIDFKTMILYICVLGELR